MNTVAADTGEDDLVEKYKTADCTTNPALSETSIGRRRADPEPSSNHHHPYANITGRLAVLIGCELLSIIPGRISTQVEPHFSYDTNTTVANARRLIALYRAKGIGAERVYIKIAAIWQGIKACEILKKEGIECNMTILFSFAQAIACGLAGVAMVAGYLGRIMELYKAKKGRNYSPEDDPGVKSVQCLYRYYCAHNIKTLVMAASFRNIGEIQQLSECDQLTISPVLLDELEAKSEAFSKSA